MTMRNSRQRLTHGRAYLWATRGVRKRGKISSQGRKGMKAKRPEMKFHKSLDAHNFGDICPRNASPNMRVERKGRLNCNEVMNNLVF